MARRKAKAERPRFNPLRDLSDETKRGVGAIVFFALAVVLALAPVGAAGVAGTTLYQWISYVVGIGYFLVPILCAVLAIALVRTIEGTFGTSKAIGSVLFLLAGLGIIDIASTGRGGALGGVITAPLLSLFELYASVAILTAAVLISFLMIFDTTPRLPSLSALWEGLRLRRDRRNEELIVHGGEGENTEEDEEDADEVGSDGDEGETEETEEANEEPVPDTEETGGSPAFVRRFGSYAPPPLSLLEKDRGRPAVGDVKANANIIKRTLANFNITVEMDEVSIGPSVTRYALKPAEGVRLSKIVSLQNNLELALAAHPIRIEAPIPGKSLVGVEMPNSAKSTVGLASLLSTSEWAASGRPLYIALGRNITGNPVYANIGKMPHMLVAGTTGSGKSVTIHAMVQALLLRNSPDVLRFIMIDPKRVELTLYNGIPHLLSPVITDPKKAIMALRWAAREMDRRYDILEAEKVRDIDSYHSNVLAPLLKKAKGGDESIELMPYIIIMIDELADIMQSYPRELEAAVVRLAQMSRAVGIHLVLSTQRPSVNVITGLIKANVPTRVALKVSSQIDSRTIIDGGGAEKLLGAGDMLYLSGEGGKPMRIQAPFVSEVEVKRVVKYLKDTYDGTPAVVDFAAQAEARSDTLGGALGGGGEDSEVDEEMYQQARDIVEESGKASTSLLQRRLRIGYGRAARIIDMLEERGVVGPANGSRPREILTRSDEGGREVEEQ